MFNALPDEHPERHFDAMMSATLARLESESVRTQSENIGSEAPVTKVAVSLLADEMMLVSGLISAFTVDEHSRGDDDDEMESETPAHELPSYAVATLRRAWPCVAQLASQFSKDEVRGVLSVCYILCFKNRLLTPLPSVT